jgi:hypothetical protein
MAYFALSEPATVPEKLIAKMARKDNDQAREKPADKHPSHPSSDTSSSSSSSSSHARQQQQQQHKRDLCLPPSGKTYLTIGQDLFSIQEYMQEQQNASLHWYMNHHDRDYRDDTVTTSSSTTTSSTQHESYTFPLPVPSPEDGVPAAVMVYTDLQTLRGLDHPVDYGTGIEYADGALKAASPPDNPLGVGLQLGLWLNGTSGCQDIVKGKLDDKIKDLVYYLGVKCPASKVFLRIGYGAYQVTYLQTYHLKTRGYGL